jgi:hypothetical protein
MKFIFSVKSNIYINKTAKRTFQELVVIRLFFFVNNKIANNKVTRILIDICMASIVGEEKGKRIKNMNNPNSVSLFK